MKRTKKVVFNGSFIVLAVLLLVASVTHIALPVGAYPFGQMTSTTSGYSTWDSDMTGIEAVSETGDEVYIAVLDTGLPPNWRDYFPKERILTKLGKGFKQNLAFQWVDEPNLALWAIGGELHESTFIGSISWPHGTYVISTIIGYYDTNYDSNEGYPLPPIIVRGIAPNANIIPIKVLADYILPPYPEYDFPKQIVNFGTTAMIAAGIEYVTDLAIEGYRPMIIIMALEGSWMDELLQTAIDRAIANDVIIIADAGNEGEDGMRFPGAYPPVISVGTCGWTKEWLHPDTGDPFYRLWWLQSEYYPYADIPEPTPLDQVYVTNWSSRQLPGQILDVLAPGSWARGPSFPGYAHIPWRSQGTGHLQGNIPGPQYYFGGTSMATPHVAGVAALMLEKNPTLIQSQIESTLKTTALPIFAGSADVYTLTETGWSFVTMSWAYNAVGSGLVQAEEAVDAVPPP